MPRPPDFPRRRDLPVIASEAKRSSAIHDTTAARFPALAPHTGVVVSASMRTPTVYIMANRRKGTLYVGVTSDLGRRAFEHRTGAIEGFTKRYDCKRLV